DDGEGEVGGGGLGVAAGEGDGLGGVLVQGHGLAGGRGRIVDGDDGDGDGGDVGVHRAVIGPEGEAVGAVVVGGRCVGDGDGAGGAEVRDRAAGGAEDAEGALGGRRDDGEGEAGAVDVGSAEGDGLGGVLGGADGLGSGDGGVVDGRHGDGDHGDVAGAGAVADDVLEAVGPVVVGGGRGIEGAIRIEAEGGCMQRTAHQGCRERVAGVVGEEAGGPDHQRRVLARGVGVVRGHRGGVGGEHADRHHGDVAGVGTVARRVHERVRTGVSS